MLLSPNTRGRLRRRVHTTAPWASSLPTWRIEGGWLLDTFRGGRTMTGYHVYIFSFVAMVFPFAFF